MYKRLLGETFIYGLGAVLPRLLNFLLLGLFTEYIQEEEFSTYSQLYAAVSFINIILSFGFETSYFRFSIHKEKEPVVLSTSFFFLFLNALIFIGFIYLFLDPIASFSGYTQHPEYITWFAWIAFIDCLCVIPFAYLRFHSKPIYYTVVKLSNTLVFIGMVIIFYVGMKATPGKFLFFDVQESVGYSFVANVLGSLASLALLTPIIRKIQLQFDVDVFKQMLTYSFPIVIAGLAFAINENFDKVLQKSVISDFDAGAYGACYKLAALMTLFVTAYRMGVEPFLFKQMNQEDPKPTYALTMELFAVISGAIVLFLLANINWISNIFLKREGYFEAIDIVPIIIIANLFYGIYHNLAVWYKNNDRTKVGAYISWIGAGITLLLNIFLLPKYGFMVSAWATVLAYGTMMTLSYIWGQKAYRIPYKTRKIAFYLLLASVLGLVNFYVLEKNFWTGNGLLLLYFLTVYYLERNYLIKTLIKS